jgi:hypothetical protein
MTGIGGPRLFHTGVNVSDLERAMDQMTEAFGTQWSEPARFRSDVWTREGTRERESVVSFSIGTDHHIELIQGIDDASWYTAIGGPKINHTGYWVDDLASEISRLERAGFLLQLGGGSNPEAPRGFAYLYNPLGGSYVELVDTAISGNVEAMLSKPRQTR